MEKKELDAWMKKVAYGDEKAFETLYEQTFRGVFAFAYSYLRNFADAEDVTQETFISVKQKAGSYRAGTDVRAWLFQITKNLCLDELRRRKLRAQKEDGVLRETYADPRIPYLDELTESLSDKEREIVILHAVWGYKHREIAEMKDLPLGTVTWIYKTALKKLKAQQENNKKEV